MKATKWIRFDRKIGFCLLLLLLWMTNLVFASDLPPIDPPPIDPPPVAIAIHGGAGKLSNMTADTKQLYETKLTESITAGYAILRAGGSSIDAIIASIEILEASPLFNAGVGAVYTWEGNHELDASIMNGRDLSAGAVAGVRTVASPIRLAHTVMNKSPHVLLSGRGAERFAREHNLPVVDNSYFSTQRRLDSLQRMKKRSEQRSENADTQTANKWGTVGAVALDQQGNLAAGTSTGGMTGKRWGRVGDSPIIGAGTYADNRSCAVSATGHGEYFIRYNVAADICARVRHKGISIKEAARQVIFEELLPNGGTGGVIVIDPEGNITMPFNTPGMYRGSIGPDGEPTIAIGPSP